MSRYNDGIVSTNKNCIACNRCIAACPVNGTNIMTKKDGESCIEVAGKKCIQCGNCILECSHHSRDYMDDTLFFFKDIEAGNDIAVMIDSSLYLMYGKEAYNIIGYLRSLGVKHIYDAGIGTEISLWAHVKYLKENVDENGVAKAFIAHTCAAVTNYAKLVAPELLPLIIPVKAPAICAAMYIREQLGETAPLAYIGPCIAMTQEVTDNATGKNVLYNVTVNHLLDYISNVDITRFNGKADVECGDVGRLACINGVFRKAVEQYFPRSSVFVNYDSLKDKVLMSFCKQAVRRNGKSSHPVLAEISACQMGCLNSAGLIKTSTFKYNDVFERYVQLSSDVFSDFNDGISYDERYRMLCDKYSNLRVADYSRQFEENFRQPYIVPDQVCVDIFNRMHKDTLAKRTINCKSCGYNSCMDMAKAIANGYAKMENCIHYLNDELENLAYVDKMTGLYNLQGFAPQIVKMMRRHPNRKYIIAMCNISKLMVINRLYGKNTGDAVINEFAHTISALTEENGVCCRVGGSIFGLCLEDTPENWAFFKDNELFDYMYLGMDFPVAVRFGICRIGSDSDSIDGSFDNAMFAMAKVTDRAFNAYIEYDKNLHTEIALDAEVTRQMKQAMSDGEFVLYLQPQYDYKTKKIVGAEALSRWVRKDGTIVSPTLFIPIFEKNGFIRNLDRYVWKRSFELVKKWMDEGRRLIPLSVNISRLSLIDDEIIEYIRDLKEEYAIDNDMIHFEVTESAYMGDQNKLIERVQKIRDMGFLIAMDDFGSGFSSLNTLKDVPLDILKLDMGFLNDETNTEKGHKIIIHMLDMSKSLNLMTIAEGVETEEQAEFLYKMGCDIIQGYLYSRPVPIEEYERML